MRVHLIDGTYELFRAHYSKRPDHRAQDGSDAKARVGLVSSLLALLHDEREAPTHLAVAFDNPVRSFRNDLYGGYKSDDGVPPELRAQFDGAEDAVRALGLRVFSMKEWEADDALATLATAFAPLVDQVRILSPDKDLGQCVTGSRIVQVDRVGERELDESAIVALRGVTPERIPDFLALVGDSADGYPGLPGFGKQTAMALLETFGPLEGVPDDPERWPKTVRGRQRLAEVWGAQKKEAFLYRRLATLVRDIPLGVTLDDLHWDGVPREAFENLCEGLDSTRLKTRPRRWKT